MRNIFAVIQKKLRLRREKRACLRSADPEKIMELAAELRDLVARTAQLYFDENGMSLRLKTLEMELVRLGELTTRPEFCKLSPEQRLELRQGLLQVRTQILTTMQQGPPPTDFIQ